MKLNRSAKVAFAVASVTALVLGAAAPAVAATRSTVIIVASNALTSLNPGTPDTNLVTNSDTLIYQVQALLITIIRKH